VPASASGTVSSKHCVADNRLLMNRMLENQNYLSDGKEGMVLILDELQATRNMYGFAVTDWMLVLGELSERSVAFLLSGVGGWIMK